MKRFFLALAWCIFMVGIGTCVNLNAGCAGSGKLETWQGCAGTHHEVCQGDLDCEYEFYKECINE